MDQTEHLYVYILASALRSRLGLSAAADGLFANSELINVFHRLTCDKWNNDALALDD